MMYRITLIKFELPANGVLGFWGNRSRPAVQEPIAAARPSSTAAAAADTTAGRQAGSRQVQANSRPGRTLAQRLSSSGGEVDMGLLQNVELNDCQPIARAFLSVKVKSCVE